MPWAAASVGLSGHNQARSRPASPGARSRGNLVRTGQRPGRTGGPRLRAKTTGRWTLVRPPASRPGGGRPSGSVPRLRRFKVSGFSGFSGFSGLSGLPPHPAAAPRQGSRSGQRRVREAADTASAAAYGEESTVVAGAAPVGRNAEVAAHSLPAAQQVPVLVLQTAVPGQPGLPPVQH